MFTRAALSVGTVAIAASMTLAASPAHAATAAAATKKSQNGWTVVTSKGVKKYKISGSKESITLRKGDASKILLDFAKRYDSGIENLDLHGNDESGYYVKKIKGTNTWSNHSSGTAMDLNPVKHPPYGAAHAGFSAAQVKKIHNLLKRYDGVIRWGGDYKGRKDPMHFEINKSVAATHKEVLKLFPPKPAPICPPTAATVHPDCIPIN